MREALIATAVAAIGAIGAVGYGVDKDPDIDPARFGYAVLGLSLVSTFALVYRLGAGLHGLGRRGYVVAGGAVLMLALALAYSEAAGRGGPEQLATRAEGRDSGYRITGSKTLVLGGPDVDGYIVSARAGVPGAVGLSLFLVPADAAGLTVVRTPLHDGRVAAALTLKDVRAAELLGTPGQGLAALREGLAHGTLALCAELVGAMERSIEITADYLHNRKQFGVPLGSFQALQHRMADMAAELELARSMLFAALASFENDDPIRRQEVLGAAKAFISNAALSVCGQGIQLHGGIGMTEEYSVGHYFKRAVVGGVLIGGNTLHEGACAAALQERVAAEVAPAQPAPDRRARGIR